VFSTACLPAFVTSFFPRTETLCPGALLPVVRR